MSAVLLWFNVVPDVGDPYDVGADARDLFKWERITRATSELGPPGLKRIQNHLATGDLYPIAFNAASRQELTGLTYAEFVDTCAINVIDEPADEPADPSKPVATAKRSSRSQ